MRVPPSSQTAAASTPAAHPMAYIQPETRARRYCLGPCNGSPSNRLCKCSPFVGVSIVTGIGRIGRLLQANAVVLLVQREILRQ
jgi:hypothetical protein